MPSYCEHCFEEMDAREAAAFLFCPACRCGRKGDVQRLGGINEIRGRRGNLSSERVANLPDDDKGPLKQERCYRKGRT